MQFEWELTVLIIICHVSRAVANMLLLEMQQELSTQIFISLFAGNFVQIIMLFMYTHSSRADKVSGGRTNGSYHTAIHDEGDGMILYEQ